MILSLLGSSVSAQRTFVADCFYSGDYVTYALIKQNTHVFKGACGTWQDKKTFVCYLLVIAASWLIYIYAGSGQATQVAWAIILCPIVSILFVLIFFVNH